MNAAGLAILVIKQHIGREPRELPGGNRVAHFFAVHLILPVETGFFPNADDVCDGNLRDDIMVKQSNATLKSVRTAQYDLYDLVERGLLVKSGAGPSCRYTTVTAAD